MSPGRRRPIDRAVLEDVVAAEDTWGRQLVAQGITDHPGRPTEVAVLVQDRALNAVGAGLGRTERVCYCVRHGSRDDSGERAAEDDREQASALQDLHDFTRSS